MHQLCQKIVAAGEEWDRNNTRQQLLEAVDQEKKKHLAVVDKTAMEGQKERLEVVSQGSEKALGGIQSGTEGSK